MHSAIYVSRSNALGREYLDLPKRPREFINQSLAALFGGAVGHGGTLRTRPALSHAAPYLAVATQPLLIDVRYCLGARCVLAFKGSGRYANESSAQPVDEAPHGLTSGPCALEALRRKGGESANWLVASLGQVCLRGHGESTPQRRG